MVLSNPGRSESFLWKQPETWGHPSGSLKPGEKRELFVQAAHNQGISKWFSQTRGYVSVLVREQPETQGYPGGSETRGETLGFVQAARNSGISEWLSQTRGEAGTFCGGRPKPGDIQVVSAMFCAGCP